jgi:phage repressor protein C with HTH and peptisase S24 domain
MQPFQPKILQRQTPKALELASFNADHELRTVATEDLEWIARIIWASQ